ncbi:MAG: DNA primase [Defluviitaleaceae bacterium]|nr:DNA primase [Defluviitaleaceae bacterium]
MVRTFPFKIRQVADILQLKIRHEAGNTGNADVDCPFCKRKSKLNLNAVKNVYRCNFCGENGGMVGLYGKVHDISNADAFREICEILGCSSTATPDCENPDVKPMHRASNDTIHQTYAMLLSLLNLATPHKEHLLSRGLSEEWITEFGYKSVPAFGQQGLCIKLIQSGCILEGVPGFYKENGEWNVKLNAPGIVIPVCSIDGRIAGLQIRLNNPVNSRKYIWVSSNDLDGGASSGAPIHFLGDPAAKRVYITDGSLKGMVAHTLSRHTFICLPGVKNLGGLDDLLTCVKANGTTETLEALDIKKLTDKQAGESAAMLRGKLSAHGFKVTSAVWEDKSLGGVDDYFLHRMKTTKNHVYNVDISTAVAV